MKAHRTDLVSFAFGLTFLALAVWWLLAQILGLTLPPVGWFLAGGLLLVGLLGLLGALRSGRHGDRATTGGAAPPAETTVAAPYEGAAPWTAPAPPEADEWSTDAVGDTPVDAVRDRPVSGPGGEPSWSPVPPPEGTADDERPTADLGDGPATRPTGEERSSG